jgi:hypothetical protein
VLKRLVLKRLVPPPSTRRTRDKTALFSTRKNNSEKKISFLFIEQIVILLSLCCLLFLSTVIDHRQWLVLLARTFYASLFFSPARPLSAWTPIVRPPACLPVYPPTGLTDLDDVGPYSVGLRLLGTLLFHSSLSTLARCRYSEVSRLATQSVCKRVSE